MRAGYDIQRVSTADNVGLSFRVAGLATRITAALIDGLILIVLVVVSILLVTSATAGLTSGSSAADQENMQLVLLLLSAGEVMIVVAYFTVAETVTAGKTPGKAAMGIRVIRVDGGTAGLGANFLRSLALIVDVIGVGPILMFFHPQARRLGDLLAGTLVVRERTPVTLTAATATAPVYLRSFEPGPRIDGLASLGQREFNAIRTFLGRPGLLPNQRAVLAARLSAPLLARMALPATAPERMWPPELLLERLYIQLLPRYGR
ncbi:MAG: RDD family protein [Candidatus Dormiibacterota bacterium]